MNKLDIVQFLITEIAYEKELFEVVKKDYEQAKEEAKKNKEDWHYKYLKYKGRCPSKSRITDNCKKIRQILLDISKEDF